MPPKAENQIVAAALRGLTATLRAEAEQLLSHVHRLEAVADQLAVQNDTDLCTRVAAATALHSLNCVIKMGWAAKAVSMYSAAIAAADDRLDA